MTRYVLVGNSIAANSAAARIHSLDPQGSITLVSPERKPFYSRCALMYHLMDHCAERDLYIGDDHHYRSLNATVVHDRAVSVDAHAHKVKLAGGDTLAYDRLLIATGALGRRLGVENEDAIGIYDFLSLTDANAIRADLPQARSAVVVGGGLIGAEIAEVFYSLSIPVHFLVREKHYLFYHAFCGTEQSRILEERFEHYGVHMHMGRQIARFEKDASGRVSAVIDNTGDRYEADIVVRAIGVEPNVEFLSGSGVPTKTGVLVDERLQSGAEEVWAAGDCAEIQFPGQERTTIQKLWYTAQPQGWVAGENMAGGSATYQLTFQYQSAMFMDLDFCSYGEMPTPHNGLQEENVSGGNGLDSIRLVHDGERVVGASFLGRALTKEDIEHMAISGMALDEARGRVQRLFSDTYGDRAPRSRVAEPVSQSRRPYFWPFSLKSARRGWATLTGGF